MNKRPTFIEGVGVALLMALAGVALSTVLSRFPFGGMALPLGVTLLSLGYLIYLLRRAPVRTGRLTSMVLWLVFSLGAGVMGASMLLYLLLQLGLIWLVRSLYFHSGLLGALADLGLQLLALAAAFWAGEQSGSVFLTLWTFFLVQALFAIIPSIIPPDRVAGDGGESAERFTQAHRVAQAALRRLTTV